MKPKRKTLMLSLDKDDPQKELEFEVMYSLTLTSKERYKRMERLLRLGKSFKKHDRKITPSIFART